MDEIPLFRAPKRRKFAKPLLAERPSSAPPLAQEDDDKSTSSTPSSSDEGDTIYPQLRKPVRHSKLGVSFTSNVRSLVSDHDDLAIVPVDNTSDKLKHVTDRFVGTTGQVVDVDKHMMAYIDSEMARRRQPDEPSNTDDATPPAHPSGATIVAHSSTPLSKEPQQQHQLAEVDLPPSAPKAPPPPKRTRKPRLGRDGRPLRPHRPKRRNSDDLARDALVEQVLHEHRLDHYQTQQPPPPPPDSNNPPSSTTTHAPTDSASLATATDPSSSTANAATAAAAATEDDEAFALRFQREFEEGLAEKQAMQRKPQKRNKDADKDGKDSKSHGPRLGGSRSARAKMVAMREAEKEKGKGVGGSGGAGR